MNKLSSLAIVLAVFAAACTAPTSDDDAAAGTESAISQADTTTTFTGSADVRGVRHEVTLEITRKAQMLAAQTVTYAPDESTADCEVENAELPLTIKLTVLRDGAVVAASTQTATPLTKHWFYCTKPYSESNWIDAPAARSSIRTVFGIDGLELPSVDGKRMVLGSSPYGGVTFGISFESTLEYKALGEGTLVSSTTDQGRPHVQLTTPRGLLTLGSLRELFGAQSGIQLVIGTPGVSDAHGNPLGGVPVTLTTR